MSQTKYLNFTFIGLCLLGFLGWWYIDNSFDNNPTHHNKAINPDAFAEKIIVTETDASGKIIRKLSSSKLLHFPDDSSTFENIKVTVLSKTKQPWHIRAKKGRAVSGSDEIKLSGGVIIERPRVGSEPPIKILTSSMTFYPNKHLATTDKPIKLTQPGTVIESVGMRANLKEGTVELLSEARAEYSEKLS